MLANILFINTLNIQKLFPMHLFRWFFLALWLFSQAVMFILYKNVQLHLNDLKFLFVPANFLQRGETLFGFDFIIWTLSLIKCNDMIA